MKYTQFTIVLMFLAIVAFSVWPLHLGPEGTVDSDIYHRLLGLIGVEVALLGGWMIRQGR